MIKFNKFPQYKPPHDDWFIVEFEDNELGLRQYFNNKFILEDNDKDII